MSAAANAAAFLSLRGRLHHGPVHHHYEQPRFTQPAAVPPEPRPVRADARTVRVTYRRGRLAGAP